MNDDEKEYTRKEAYEMIQKSFDFLDDAPEGEDLEMANDMLQTMLGAVRATEHTEKWYDDEGASEEVIGILDDLHSLILVTSSAVGLAMSGEDVDFDGAVNAAAVAAEECLFSAFQLGRAACREELKNEQE